MTKASRTRATRKPLQRKRISTDCPPDGEPPDRASGIRTTEAQADLNDQEVVEWDNEDATVADEHLSLTSGAAHIDDPVRIYLMQMGEIPMLTRDEEITAAKKIEKTRTKFRRSMLATDFVLEGAVSLLTKVRDGKLRLDRTIEISVTNTAEKKRSLKRLVPNLETIRHLLQLNQADFRVAESKRHTAAEKRAAWRRVVVRRNKIVRLVEEMND